MLLVGAGLLVQTLWRLQHVNTGFAGEHVLTTRIPLSEHQYPEAAQRALLANLLERVYAPGVLSAARTDALPSAGNTESMPFNVEGDPTHFFNEPSYEIAVRSVSPAYFAVLGISLRRAAGSRLKIRAARLKSR